MSMLVCHQVQTVRWLPFLAALLVIVHETKSIFELGQEFNKSNLYLKFERKWVIND